MIFMVKVIIWNVNGIASRTAELAYLATQHQADLILLTETRPPASFVFRVPGYTFIEKRGQVGHAGVAIGVREGLPFRDISDHIAFANTHATGVRLSDGTAVVAYYNSPAEKLTRRVLDGYRTIARRVIVAGDFNATHVNWGCHRNNANGNTLNAYINLTESLLHFPREPTHIPPNGRTPTVVDMAITTNVADVGEMQLEATSSDHAAVIFGVGEDAPAPPPRMVLDYRNACWREFRDIMNTYAVTNDIADVAALDQEVKVFTERICDAVSRTIPLKKIDLRPRIDLPEHILEHIAVRNRYRRIYQRTRDRYYLDGMKATSKLIRTLVAKHRNDRYADRLRRINRRDGSVWKLNKHLRLQRSNINVIMRQDGTTAFRTNDIVTEFATAFADYHTTPPTDRHTQDMVDNTVYSFLLQNPPHPHHSEPYLTTPRTVKALINRTPSTKAPGPDQIQNIILKNLPRKSLVQLTNIINALIRLQHFPTPWKQAIVIPVPKPAKDPRLPGSYRPISLLSTMSKIAERIILNAIQVHVEDFQILPREQFGFRAGHSTEQQAARVVVDCANAFNSRRNHTAMTLLDLEKAFDRVWTAGLLYKMIITNFPPPLVRIVATYLQGRTFRVKVDKSLSCPVGVPAGVPQGSVLGPALFNIYTADVPRYAGVNVALYADDVLVYAHAFSQATALAKLQTYLIYYEQYLATWKLTANPAKSNTAIVTQRKAILNTPRYPRLLNVQIPYARTIKYLGVRIDKFATFKDATVANANKALALLRKYWYLFQHRALTREVKLHLYTAVIRPVLLYGAPVWAHTAPRHIRRLQVAQNKCLRAILGVDSSIRISLLHEAAGVPMIADLVRNTAINFYDRTTRHENPLVRSITATRMVEARHKLPYSHLPIYNTPI